MSDRPVLLTPGPLTTSDSVKAAMLRDWGSRDGAFITINRQMRDRLLALANAETSHVCVPIQGSGTFAVEATIGTLLPPGGRLLVLVNGAYGERMVRIAETLGRSVTRLDWPEDQPVAVEQVDAALRADPAITDVALVYCETTSGLLNPLQAVAELVDRHRRRLIVDSMSAFGALPVDARRTPFTALVASSNKCLQGVPGLGFALIRREALAAAKGNAHSLSLDLHDQWQGFERNEQWRFTPPTHVVAALMQALDEHRAEGGVEGRGARYRANHRILVEGMTALGFRPLLPDAVQAPIIVTFRMPADPAFVFSDFYERLRARNFTIYPGKLTAAPSFRIGCIGDLRPDNMRAALAAIRDCLTEMGVTSGQPAD